MMCVKKQMTRKAEIFINSRLMACFSNFIVITGSNKTQNINFIFYNISINLILGMFKIGKPSLFLVHVSYLSSRYPPFISWHTNSLGVSKLFLGLLLILATHTSSLPGFHEYTSSRSNRGLHTGFLLSI